MTSEQRCEDLKRLARPAACYGNILAAQFVHPHCYTGEAIAAGHAQKQNTAVRITQKKPTLMDRPLYITAIIIIC